MAGSSSMAGDAIALLGKLRSGVARKGGFNTLVLIDLSAVKVPLDDDFLVEELLEIYARRARVRGGEAYGLVHVNAAIIADLDEMKRVEVAGDLKMAVWKLLCEELPDNVEGVDQSKLVRTIDLNTQTEAAIRFLEAFEDRAKEVGAMTSANGTRALNLGDIAKVREFHTRLGDKKFTETYVASQTAIEFAPGAQPKPFFKEFFVRMDLLGRDALGGEVIHENDPLFGQLTVALDPLVLKGFPLVNPGGGSCALNLNIETLHTNIFKAFLQARGDAKMKGICAEVRAENVVRDMDGYVAVRKLVRSLGGKICVDVIEPKTLGVLRLAGFEADRVKINWRADTAEALARDRRDLAQAQEAGCRVILARVDTKLGIAVGQEVGITAFQGFEIDGMLT